MSSKYGLVASTQAVDRHLTSHFSLTVCSYASEIRGHSLLGLHGTDPVPSLAGEKNSVRDTGVESGEKMKSHSCEHFG